MIFVLGLILGIVLGINLGVFLMCLITVSKE